jgi:hypothetical protein
MKPHIQHAKRLHRRRGVSMSGLRLIEAIVIKGDHAFYRQFNSATRRQLKGADYGR